MKAFLEVEPGECRWPVGKSDCGGHLFCAEATGGGREKYCTEHAARAAPQRSAGGPHEERFFVTRMDKRPATFSRSTFGAIGAKPVVQNTWKGVRQDLTVVLGQKSPETHRIAAHGARGKRVDADGYETAEHEPDLVELFGAGR